MNMLLKSVALSVMLIVLTSAAPVVAQTGEAHGSVKLPVTGTFARGGDFTGAITINRFEARVGRIVAIGFVQGVLRRGQSSATGFAGEVVWPVVLKSGGVVVSSINQPASGAMITRIASGANGRSGAGIVQVQTACQVLDLTLGPVDVNLLGFQVSLSPVALSLAGETGTPLGGLVCSLAGLLGNVAALVDVLNSVLGLLTGLLGGLTGGLG